MNKTSVIGFSVVAVVLYLGVLQHAKSTAIFLDSHAIMLVIGGTLAAAMVAYPYKTLTRTVDYLIWGLLFKTKQKYVQVTQDLANVRGCYMSNQQYSIADESHPFLKESVVFLLNKNISNEALEDILSARSDYFRKKYKEDAKVLNALGKYPPAFGLLGASTGMIEMMQNLGGGGSAGIGQSMAVALVATFWGIGLANFVILPLADSASKAADEDNLIRNLITEGMILIRQNVNDDHFQAHLRGYLNVSDRSEVKIYTTTVAKLYNFNTTATSAPAPSQPTTDTVPNIKAQVLSLKKPKSEKRNLSEEEASGRVEMPPSAEIEENSGLLKDLQFKDLRKDVSKRAK